MPVPLKLDTAMKTPPLQLFPGKKGKKNRVAAFFYRINPINWYDEFSDIIISLQEFGNKKNK